MANEKILIVDDERIIAKDIQNILKKFGYSVSDIASTGEEAIKKAGATRPDIVLMDIKLKGCMDGIDTAEQIRIRFNIPSIYLTAYSDEKTLKRAKTTEPYGYIHKPFEERELRSTIEMALYKIRIEKELRIKDYAISSSINAIVIADLYGNITYVNQSFLKMWGYVKKEQVLGQPLVTFWKFKGKYLEILDEVFDKDGWIGELDAERKDGSIINVQLSAGIVKDSSDKPINIMNSFIDITDRKKAEAEIIQTKEYLQNIINSASELIVSFDQNNRVLIWNKTAEHITGYKKRQIVGKTIAELNILALLHFWVK